MSELIDDTLDFTRGRAGGGIALETQPDLPVAPVLEQVIEEARGRWPGRLITTDFVLEGGVCCDRRRLVQLFSNLLTNAMTHG